LADEEGAVSKGPRNNQYRLGAAFEREVLLLMKMWLHKKNKCLVEGIRSAGSKGIRDLALIYQCKSLPQASVVWYVSCKRNGQIAPQEKLILLQTCKAIRAVPAFAYRREISIGRWQTRLRVWDYDGNVVSDQDLKAELGMDKKAKLPPKKQSRKRNPETAPRRILSRRDYNLFLKMRALMEGPLRPLAASRDPVAKGDPEGVD
jgi:hypothetical protein